VPEEKGSDLDPAGTPASPDERFPLVLSEQGPWTAPVGSAFVYDVSAQLTMEMGLESVTGQTVDLSFEAKMRVELLARRENEVLAGVSLSDVLLRASKGETTEGADEALEGLRSQLSERSLVRMNAAGDTLAYRFPPSMELEAKNWIRTLVGASRFVVPEGHAETWETTETDTTGRFLARYRLMEASRVQKEKVRYLDTLPVAELALLPEVSGSASGEFDLPHGWLLRSELVESTALALPEAGLSMHIGTRVRLERAALERCAPIAADASDPWEGAWASLDGRDEEQSSARVERNEDLRFLDGATLQDLLAEIEALMRADKLDSYELFLAREKLAALVRLQPETLATLQGILDRGFLEDAVAEVVLSAVGAAGTGASEVFLTALAADEQGKLALRIGAVVSLFQVEHSSPETFDAIRALAMEADESGELAASSLLLLGALAKDGGGTSRADRIAALLALKESASDPSIWLRALGNCGGAEILEAISPYLRDPDGELRLSAVESLRGVLGEPALELLDLAAHEDASDDVRAAAAELLGQRWGAGAEEAVRYVLEKDPSAAVRSRALNGVAQAAMENEEARILLSYYAEHDPDSAVRQHAHELLEDLEA
jgi:hypothetical protein